MRDALLNLSRGRDLSAEQVADAFGRIMAGEAEAAQVGGLLVGLQVKGPTAAELATAAGVMRRHATRLDFGDGGDLLDTCGTGGDKSGTFNVSTAAALVAAACGVRVVKHGNRSATSNSGSADVLEALGVRLEGDETALRACLDGCGICFAYARSHHPAMRHVAAVRASLAVPTVFNLLGPLTNPAGAKRQLMGVYSSALTETIAEVMGLLGTRRAWVVAADDGLDELSTMSPTRVSELRDGTVTTRTISPAEFDFAPATFDDLRVNSAAESAAVIRGVFDGEEGPARDIVLFNAAAALVVAGAADDLADALEVARHAVDTGRAGETLDALVAASNG